MPFHHLFKIVLIGDSGVGKSNLLSRFTQGSFSEEFRSTIGVEFASKLIRIEDNQIRLQIWDTAGQERYRAITTSYYRGALAALLVYDTSTLKTFNNLSNWLEELQNNSDSDVVVWIVGNKTDLIDEREVTTQQGMEYAAERNLGFVETSARNNDSVNEAFMGCLNKLYKNLKEKGILAKKEREFMLHEQHINPHHRGLNVQQQQGEQPQQDQGGGCCTRVWP